MLYRRYSQPCKSGRTAASPASVKERVSLWGRIDCSNIKKLLTVLSFLSKGTPVINEQSGPTDHAVIPEMNFEGKGMNVACASGNDNDEFN